MNAAVFEGREDPGRKTSAVLAAVVHVALAIFLVYGIRWQTRMPEAVEVELVRAVPAPPAAVVEPPPEPVPAPKVEPKPEPKVEPKAEPKPAKPDIALKEKEKPKSKPEPKVEPKSQSRPVPDKSVDKLINDDLKRLETKRKNDEIERDLASVKSAQAKGALDRAKRGWQEKIAQRIRSNIIRPPNATGNPEAIFEVVVLPDGSIFGEAKMKKSTGNPALDAAIERAIKKSDPLPKPEDPAAYERLLRLQFRPLEEQTW
ncbi:MAG: hypothetical protein MOGDAGHF_01726 [Rhodocyclaceae bacterium]|jgi:colicin import membrane protein|nr:hypothetical protein [Rhodocyclaceae bacterium]